GRDGDDRGARRQLGARRPLGVPGADERGRGQARELNALPGQVRLVGVAAGDAGLGQVGRAAGGVDQRDKAAEPQHPLQHLGAVPDRGLAAAAQLAGAQPDLRGDVFGPGPRAGQQVAGGPHRGIGPAGQLPSQLPGQLGQPGRHLIGVQVRGQGPVQVGPQVSEVDTLIAQLAERDAEQVTAGPGPEPHADQHCARLSRGGRRTGVRPGHEPAAAVLPDDVGAAVGQHQGAGPVAAGPQASQERPEGGRCGPLPVSGHDLHVSRMPGDPDTMPPPGRGWPFRSRRRPGSCGEMVPMATPDIDRAVQFLAANARVIDQRRYERLFEGGAAEPVRDALAAYRNPDGGFGHALEPDGRAPTSEPIAAKVALHVMDETDVWDDGLVSGVLSWLAATAPAEGGVLFVHDGMAKWPHAPWLVPDAGPRGTDGAPPASDIQTGLMAGTLHKRGVRQPWLDGADQVMWSRIDGLTEPTPYGMAGMLPFLQYVPDRDRARRAMDRLGPMILDAGIVTLDPDASGEV